MRISFPAIWMLLATTVSLHAQHRRDTVTGLLRAVYLENRDLVLRTYAGGITLDAPDDRPSDKPRAIKGWRYSFAFHDYFSVGADLIAVDLASRTAYRLAGDTLILLDSLPHPKMTISAQVFRRDSGIYMLGGYGLWGARAGLLILDPPYHRWRPVAVHPHSWPYREADLPPEMLEHKIITDSDRLYAFYGKTVNPLNPLDMPHNPEVWIFDFTAKRWDYGGNLNRDAFPAAPESHQIIHGGSRYFMLPDDRATAEIHAPENRIQLYESTPASREIKSAEDGLLAAFFRKGRIYFHKRINPSANTAMTEWRAEYRSIPIEQFLGSQKTETYFYDSFRQRWAYVFYGILLLVAAAAFVLFRKYRRKTGTDVMTLTGNGIAFRNQVHDLDPATYAVLKKLVEADGPVSSTDLLEVVENPNLKYAHNNRVKNTVIRQLNLQLKSILNERQDLITSFASEEDKRFRWYRIDQSRFGK